jgi:hypothetical protein
VLLFKCDAINDRVTIEHRVRDQSARVNPFLSNRGKRSTVALIQCSIANVVTSQLIRIQRLDISTVVLIKIGEFVIEKHRVLKIGWDIKAKIACLSSRLIVSSCLVLHESPSRGKSGCGIGVFRPQVVGVMLNISELKVCGVSRLRRLLVAIGVVDGYLAHLVASQEWSRDREILHTKLLPQIRRPPMGANSKPRMKKVGRTTLGVRIGCQAFSLCCLNAVSANEMSCWLV